MATPHAPPFVITVSGSDASGAAGMQADNRAIHATGAFPLNVISALTLQTDLGVQSIDVSPPDLVRMHLINLLNTYPVSVMKVGMLGNSEIVEVVAEALEQFPDLRLILDPVIEASSGRPLLDGRGIEALVNQLLPRTFLLTPNLPELARLAGVCDVDTDRQEIDCVNVLLEKGCRSVLVKGGHRVGDNVEDRLYDSRGSKSYPSERIETKNSRGTGCALAALISGGLACGISLDDSISQAKSLLSESLDSHSGEDWPVSGPSFL